MKVLVVAPHPDDEVLGCGGVMARHADSGDEVHVVVVTRGAPEIEELVKRVREEAERAHRLLGVVGTRYLDFYAPRLDAVPIHEVADALSQAVSDLRPELIYIPHHGDLHVDHRVAFQAALVAARPIRNSSVRTIMAYETLSETEWSPPGPDVFGPTVFTDVSMQMERKLEAMKCFASQLQEFPHPRSIQTLQALATFRGASVGFPAAEAFALIRDLQP